jgi:hypothetical protein
MKRVYPRRITDKIELSRLLEQYVTALNRPPMNVGLQNLVWDTQVPEPVFRRLMHLHQQPDDANNIAVSDFHILFSNIMFHYPTVKIWKNATGMFIFEM